MCAIIRQIASGLGVSGVTLTTGLVITSAAVRPRGNLQPFWSPAAADPVDERPQPASAAMD